MTGSFLSQGQRLKSISLPDYAAEGLSPWVAGEDGTKEIIVDRLNGPMDFYDVAKIVLDDGHVAQIIPLHQCDVIQT